MPTTEASRWRRRPPSVAAGTSRSVAERPPVDAAEALATACRLLTGQTEAIAIGQRYLELFPREADPALLRARLAPGIAAADLPTARAVLRGRIARDLRRNNTVRIDHWRLARAECRACALIALAAAALG